MRFKIAAMALAFVDICSNTTVSAIVQSYTGPDWIVNSSRATFAAIDDKLVVGAPYSSPNGDAFAGAIYIFDAATGALVHEVLNPAYAGSEYFGWCVANAGGYALVGHPDIQTATGGIQVGRAYLLDINSGEVAQWIENPAQKIDDRFGRAVASIPNGYAISSGQWGGYITVYPEVGEAFAIFDPFQETSANTFGHRLYSFEGDLYAPWKHSLQADSRVLRFSAVDGSLLGEFKDPDPAGYGFGSAMAHLGDTIAIGDFEYPSGSMTKTGAVHLFDAETHEIKVTIENPAGNESWFGACVVAIEDKLLVGSRGFAYLFDGHTGQLIHTYTPPNPAEGDFFGHTLGTIGDDFLIADNWTVYRFDVVPEPETIWSMLTVVVATALSSKRAVDRSRRRAAIAVERAENPAKSFENMGL